MSPQRRKLKIDPAALEIMLKFNPTDAELEDIWAMLFELAKNPALGYPVILTNPRVHRLDIGRFRVQYEFGETHVHVSYIGAF